MIKTIRFLFLLLLLVIVCDSVFETIFSISPQTQQVANTRTTKMTNCSKSKLNRPSNIFEHHPRLSEEMFDARDGDEAFFHMQLFKNDKFFL